MFFEDFEVGKRYLLDPVSFTQEDIIAFAKEYDPLRIHTDISFAQAGPFGGLIASGLHTSIAVWRQFLRLRLLDGEIIAGLELEQLKWLRPVRPGDVLCGTVEIIEKRPLRRQERGVVRFRTSAKNQNGELVFTQKSAAMFQAREIAPKANMGRA